MHHWFVDVKVITANCLKMIRKKGFLKVRVDGEVKDLVPKMQVDRYKIHDIELVVDRLQVTDDLKAKIEPKCATNFEAWKRPDVFAR